MVFGAYLRAVHRWTERKLTTLIYDNLICIRIFLHLRYAHFLMAFPLVSWILKWKQIVDCAHTHIDWITVNHIEMNYIVLSFWTFYENKKKKTTKYTTWLLWWFLDLFERMNVFLLKPISFAKQNTNHQFIIYQRKQHTQF